MPEGDDIQVKLEPTAENNLREYLGEEKRHEKWGVSSKQVSLNKQVTLNRERSLCRRQGKATVRLTLGAVVLREAACML